MHSSIVKRFKWSFLAVIAIGVLLAAFSSVSALQKARAQGSPDPAILKFAIFGAGDKADGNSTGTGKKVDVIGGMVGGNRRVTVRGVSNVTGIRSGADTYIGNDADVESDSEVDNGQEEEGTLNAISGIIANGKVTLTQKSDVTGNINGEQIRVGVKASVTGNVAVAGKLQMVNSGRITGNADATSTSIGNNTKITGTLKLPVGANPTGSGINNGSATIGTVAHGTPQAPQTFSKILLPLPKTYTAATAASADRTVANGGTLTLAPGTYRDIELKQNATLNLTNGTYIVRKIKTAAKSKLNLNVTGGDIIILATDDVDLGQDLTSNLTGGTAKKVYLETAGTFSTSANSNWNGTVFSTKSNAAGQDGIAIGQKNNVTGALYSNQQVHIAANSTVTYQIATTFSNQFPQTPSDTTAPVITPTVTGTLGNNGWYVSNVTVTWNVADPESAITSSTGCVPTTLSADTAGTTVTCSATNAVNLTSNSSLSIKIDKTAPTISGSRTPAVNANGWNNSDVTVTFTCTDALSGVNACTNPAVVSSEGTNQSATGTAPDNAGNTASATVSGINIDKTAPTITGSRTPAANANGWNNTDVTVSFTCADAGSGIDTCSSPTILTSEGANQSVAGTVTDKAGNTASATVSGINIDKTAPTITGSRTPVANANGWNNTDVTVSFVCADAGSGVDRCSNPTTLTSEGTNQSVTGTVTDKAGNTASATVGGINIDKTAPTISGSRTPAANANGWNNTNVTVSFVCADAGSGVDTCSGSTLVSTEGANQSVTGTVTDKAGNTASVTVSGINIDKTAPTITGSASPAANANGWNNTNVTVSFTCADSGSGVSVCSGPTTLTIEGSGQNVTGNVTDLAGNTASASVTVNIDKTMPTVSVVLPAIGGKYSQDSIVAANYSCTDTLSGIASCAGDIASGANIDTSGLGNKTFTVTATDKAGNVKAVTINYEIIEGVLSYAIFGAGDNADGNTTSVGHNVNVVGGLIGGNRKVVIRGGSNAVGVRSGADTYMGNDTGGEDDVEGSLGVTLGIIANGDVTLTQKATVLGNIDGKTLRVGTSATVQGNAVVSLGLTMLANAIISSNADAATASLGTNASILGTLRLPIGIAPNMNAGALIGTLINGTPKTPKTFIKYALPAALTYTASSLVADDRTVANGTTMTLSPGTYRDLDMRTGSTLNLSAGTYVFRNINSASNSTININVAGGAVNILAANNVGFGTALTVNVTGGSAKKVYWETAGNFDTASDTTWVGTVYSTKSNAPGTASVSIGTSNTVTGALFSNQQVKVTGGSIVTRSVADAFSSRVAP